MDSRLIFLHYLISIKTEGGTRTVSLGAQWLQTKVKGGPERQIRRFDRQGDAWELEVEYPEAGSRYIVEKGSIAVDGISLTIAALKRSNAFSVAIIPHTFENTNLKAAKAGVPVNIEFDVLAKYVENLIKPYAIRND